MTDRTAAGGTVEATRSPASSFPTELGITVYGCSPAEAALFEHLAPARHVRPLITERPLDAVTAQLARGTRYVSVDHRNRVDGETLRALRRVGVRHLSTRSVGSDHVDTEAAARLGVTVETTAYPPDGVADFTVLLVLMALRGTGAVLRRVDAHDYRPSATPGRELRDLTVGVVGTGRIGGAVVDRLRGFGPRILTHDTRSRPGAGHVPLDELVRDSDVVTLHVPLTPDTHHLLDRRRIARLKPGAVVVNTGRGALIDTDALVVALESGRLGGAALDVVEGEDGVFSVDHRRSPVDNPALLRLQRLPNVVVTPHIAFHTDRAQRAIVENTIGQCVAFAEGGRAWTA